ncbi:MAG: hypothetical protein AB7F89_14165 [Pirellulaceae bacterium]
MRKSELRLSSTSRKALCVHVGESAGVEIANLLQSLAERVALLERSKVSVTPIAPMDSVNLMAKVPDELS